MSEPREEYYALEKCAAGRDIRGTDFITVKIDVRGGGSISRPLSSDDRTRV